MLKVYVNGIDKSIDLVGYNSNVTSQISTTGTVEIGYYKPISDLYIELITPNETSETVVFNHFTPTETVTTITDKSKNLTQSGFISWNRESISPVKTIRNNQELYWYELKASGDMGNIVFRGIDIVFSDDSDLKEDYPDITDSLPSGEVSFIKFHKSARDRIIQSLNNQNIRKVSGNLVNPTKITEWDLLQISEMRVASKYMTLGLIFKWLSDQVDDKYIDDSRLCFSQAESFLNMPTLAVDIDDDGKEDSFELNRPHATILQRF